MFRKDTRNTFFLFQYCLPLFSDRCAEGEQGKLGEFEALLAEGDPDDRYTVDQAAYDVGQCQFPSGNEQPDDVQQHGTGTAAVFDLFSEGEKGQFCKFEALESPGDPDDRNAPENTGEDPAQSGDYASQNKP